MTAHFRHMLSSSDSSVTLPYSALIISFLNWSILLLLLLKLLVTVGITNIIECLLCVRHYAKYFICTFVFHPPNNHFR